MDVNTSDSDSDISHIGSFQSSLRTELTDVSLASYLDTSLPPKYLNQKVPEYQESCPEYTPPTESLPSYHPTIEYFGLCLRKLELTSPYKLHNKPEWEVVLMEINSTQLVVYELGCDSQLKHLITGLFMNVNNIEPNSKWHQLKVLRAMKVLHKYYPTVHENRLLFEPTTCRNTFAKVVKQLNASVSRKYTLNSSKLGLAPTTDLDQPGNNTVRIRVELHQMLLQFWSFHSMINWFRNFVVAKDLCSNFDDKGLSKFRMLPSIESVNELRLLQLLSDEPLNNSPDFTTIQGHLLHTKNKFSEIETKLVRSGLPILNSFDNWNHLILSNFDRFSAVVTDGNLFINYNNLNKPKTNPTHQRCRLFSIEQEGLVSLRL